MVNKDHLCIGVLKGEIVLFFRPPSVKRHRHCTNRQNRRKRLHPLWEIAHRDRNAIAPLNAVGVDEGMGNCIDSSDVVSETPTLVLVDNEGSLFAASGLEDVTKGVRSVLERSIGHAANLAFRHF